MKNKKYNIANLLKTATGRAAGIGRGIRPEDADVLLSFALKKDAAFIFAHPEYEPPPKSVKKFLEYAKRRSKDEPVHYILSKKEFYGREFIMKRPVLIPRPETETLVDIALEEIRADKWAKPFETAVFDIGCGTGAVGVTLAIELEKTPLVKTKNFEVYMSDTDKRAVKLAKLNAKILCGRASFGLAGVSAPKALVGSNLGPWRKKITQLIKKHNKIFIVANLPYISKKIYSTIEPQIKKYESKKAILGGKNGYEPYLNLARGLKKIIGKTNGGVDIKMLLEISPEQATALKTEIKKIFEEGPPKKNKTEIKIKKDLARKNRFLLALI